MLDQPPIYDYILFGKQATFEAFRHRPITQPDAYLSEDLDSELSSIRDALNKGYRWVRTDGDYAVFEKESLPPLLQERAVPSPIHLISTAQSQN